MATSGSCPTEFARPSPSHPWSAADSPAARSLAVRSSLVFELVVLFRVVTEDVPVDEFRHSLVAVGPIDGERHDDDRTPEESEGERVGKNAVADAHEREDTADDRP